MCRQTEEGFWRRTDRESLRRFGRLLTDTFAHDLAKQASSARASNTRGGSGAFQAQNLVDGKPDTYWATDDGVKSCRGRPEFSARKSGST